MEWQEVRARAVEFVKEWQGETRERAEAQSFWNDFFHVFGIKRRRVAVFEHHVDKLKKAKSGHGFIDLLWTGVMLAEHKSAGKSLTSACEQATDYFDGLDDTQLPEYVVVSDFARLRLLHLDSHKSWEFSLEEFPDKIRLFSFILGLKQKTYASAAPVTSKAGEMLGELHDLLLQSGYLETDLESYLVRLLFCLFADDTGIFAPKAFADYIDGTRQDGSDLGGALTVWFEALNTPPNKRPKTLSEALAGAPYVNGRLFERRLATAAFSGRMRSLLIECAQLNWSAVCPSVFGSLFESIMDPQARRRSGAHYTAETNIRKVIEPLFLDELRAEFEAAKRNKTRLSKLHKKLSSLRFLDPACGCGNFLVVSYRELRQLEIEVVKEMFDSGIPMDVFNYIQTNVDQFYGVEQNESAVQVARVALWLTDHQMNNVVSREFGEMYMRLPLVTSPYIVHGNALRLDWRGLVRPLERATTQTFDYIFGNPPFGGAQVLTEQQSADMRGLFSRTDRAGDLDYVCGWYKKAAEYTRINPKVQCAFVSTSSISQGEQPAMLWNILFRDNVIINFAHRTFKWKNEGRNNAAVHVVIIGFSHREHAKGKKLLYSYVGEDEEPVEEVVGNITPYLTDGETVLVFSRNAPLGGGGRMGIGNQPIDNGHYLFTEEEMRLFVRKEPNARKYFRRWMGSEEFIKGKKRWVLLLMRCPNEELSKMPYAKKLVEAVRTWRTASKRQKTRQMADTPTHFDTENFPEGTMLLVPKTSSETRKYLPMGFIGPETVVSDAAFLAEAELFHFGVLQSLMHMAWMRQVCGRLESRYRYSATMVYNNFPWPRNVTVLGKQKVEKAAKELLDVREKYLAKSTIAQLYDDAIMPDDLRSAHKALDRVVDECYGRTFMSEKERVEYLLGLYKQMSK